MRPTSYRKTFVAKLQNLVSELIEQDSKEYQNRLLGSRATGLIFKQLKSLTKDSNFPSELEYDGRTAYKTQNQASLFNLFFNSVFSAKEPFRIEDIKVENPTRTNFSISKANIKSFPLEIDITKTRGPNGIPPILYQRTSEQMSSTLHKVFKNIKRLKRLTKKWKVAAESPICKKGNRRLMNNYRGISLLDIDSKCFEKCMYEPLYNHFVLFMSDHQHGVVHERSTLSNMIKFLQRVHLSLECNKEDNKVAFYSDFSKAFDRVPHRLLLEKCG